MKYGCIGEKLTHSFSKEIHRGFANYEYEIKEIPRDKLDAFLNERDFSGINVTIPYKQDVIAYLHEIDEVAKRIGAVNTILNRNAKLFGYNTDHFGMCAMLCRANIHLNQKKVLVLGTGGTSKTAVCVAKDLGAKTVLRVSRSAKDGAITYEEAKNLHRDAEIIINTTPCGMYPNAGIAPVDLLAFPNLSGVADAIYNPLRPTLIQQANSLHIPQTSGLYMLVAQAAMASAIFQGTKVQEDKIEEVYRRIYQSKENIVLTGMPGSGKTTAGEQLAKMLHRPFLDTDDLIVNKIGCSIAGYFATHTEEDFRNIESECIRTLAAPLTGYVIATGGGAVLRNENINALKQNGKLFFIDRPVDKLIPTESRPLSNDAETIRKRYHERYVRYIETADEHIPSDNILQHTIQKIKERFSI